ncbi:hypothetical protein AAVH_29769 [Aphelenchoides avenae]|nr:hypothetical protein AAVH_29769 [Aphelenchus avenae]
MRGSRYGGLSRANPELCGRPADAHHPLPQGDFRQSLPSYGAFAFDFVYGGQENVIDVAHRHKMDHSCMMAIRAEFIIVCDFLRSSGVLDLCDADSDRDFICQSLTKSFLYSWKTSENVLNTLKNFGHHSRRLFFFNESYVELTDRSLEAFYRPVPRISDQPHVVRHGMDFYTGLMDAATKMAGARLDETENAVLTLIFS